MKRIISFLLALMMLISAFSLAVSAKDTESKEYGAITWTYNSTTRVLTLSGEGSMAGFGMDDFGVPDSNGIPADWFKATKIVVEEGVTTIGHFAFQWFDSVKEVSLPAGIVSIGEGAFHGMASLESLVIPDTVEEMYYPFYTSAPPKVIVFLGNAPLLRGWATDGDTHAVNIYYPDENETWTTEYKAQMNRGFGGGVRWNGEKSAVDAFSDVKPWAWHTSGIEYVYQNGIMLGMGNGEFAPANKVTREQLMQVLSTLRWEPDKDYPPKDRFKDVVWDSWYCQAVYWAKEHGITSGLRTGYFGVGEYVTREQLATFILNYVDFAKCKYEINGDLSAFDDADKVSDWAVDGMTFCVENGIIQGRTITTLDPKGYATRAELAQILSKFLEAGYIYRVDFDDNGADSCAYKFKYITSGELFGYAPSAKKEGYINGGWWYGDINIQNNTRLNISEHITVTKLWSDGTKVYFHPDGGECDVSYKLVNKGDPLGELPVPTKEGYTFEGWLYSYNDESFIVTSETVIVNDRTGYYLKAQWKPVESAE
ncbi:MAG: S-layer homology domain-containing protein [Clostridia bacterium]|nr:S-layer homology domain-containing protein [Clostridia bacterium]